MRAKKYLIWAEWLNNLMIVLLYYVVAEWMFGMLKVGIKRTYVVMIAAIVVLSYLARVYIRKLYLYVLAHVLVWLIMLIIPIPITCKALGIVILGIMTVCNFIFWTEERLRSFNMVNAVAVTVILLIFIHASAIGQAILTGESYVCGICFIALFFVRTYLLNAVKFSMDMQISENTPLKEMFRINGRMVLVLVGGFTMLMVFARADTLASGIRSFMGVIAGLVRKIMIFLISHIFSTTEAETVIESRPGMVFEPGQAAFAPVWLITLLQALERVFTIMAMVLVVYVLIKALVAFVRMYFARRGYEISTTDREAYTDVEERIRHGSRRKRRRLYMVRDERERVRRRYKRAVFDLKRVGYVIKAFHTPRERAFDVLADLDDLKGNEFLNLTEEYEKIRYGR